MRFGAGMGQRDIRAVAPGLGRGSVARGTLLWRAACPLTEDDILAPGTAPMAIPLPNQPYPSPADPNPAPARPPQPDETAPSEPIGVPPARPTETPTPGEPLGVPPSGPAEIPSSPTSPTPQA